MVEAQPHQAGAREHNRVEVAPDTGHPGGDITAQRDHLEVLAHQSHLRGPPGTAGSNPGACGQGRKGEPIAAAQHVLDRATRRHGGDDQAGGGIHRQVLEAVDRHIDFTGNE